jgi:large subunit ribosomal protein L31e
MAEEKILTINLYNAWKRTKYWKRAKKSVTEIRKVIAKNFRVDEKDVVIDPWLNAEVWKNSISNPPRKIKVKASKEEGKVVVELFETPKKKLKAEKKKLLKEAKKEEKKKGEKGGEGKKEGKKEGEVGEGEKEREKKGKKEEKEGEGEKEIEIKEEGAKNEKNKT